MPDVNKEKEIRAVKTFLISIGAEYLFNASEKFDEQNFSMERRALLLGALKMDLLFEISPTVDPTIPATFTVIINITVKFFCSYARLAPFQLYPSPVGPLAITSDITGISPIQIKKLQDFHVAVQKAATGNDTKTMTLEQLSKLYPQLDFTGYLNALTLNEMNFNRSYVVAIKSISHLNLIMETLKKDKRLLSDHQIIQFWSSMINVDMTTCFKDVALDLLDMSMNTLIAEKLNISAEKKAAEVMFPKLRKEFDLVLKTASWMDYPSKQNMRQKLERMKADFVISEEILSPVELVAYYKSLNTSKETYFESIMAVHELNMRFNYRNASGNHKDNFYLKRLGGLFLGGVVNALNVRKSNRIFITAALIGKPFAIPNTPDFVTGAGMGFVIGHEMGHSFDATGVIYNASNLADPNMLTNKSRINFEVKKECFINQYNKFVEPTTNQHVNGRLTLDENMADHWGMRTAYLTTFGDRRKSVPNTMAGLPGLMNYTVAQQFWMMFASNWCETKTFKDKYLWMLTNSHTISKFRINGAVQNIKEFARDFKCPNKANMNPTKRCSLFTYE